MGTINYDEPTQTEGEGMVTIIPGDETVYTVEEGHQFIQSDIFKEAILKSFRRCPVCYQIFGECQPFHKQHDTGAR